MNVPTDSHESTSLHDYLSVIRRRKWVIVLAVVVVLAAALVFSYHEQHKYRATAEVLLSQANLASSLSGIPDQTLQQQADRRAETQAKLAATPTVAMRTLKAAGLASSRTPGELLGSSTVSPQTGADLLDFRVTDSSRTLAARLANEYARQYTIYRRQLDTAAIVAARKALERRIAELELGGDKKSALYASLVEKDQQLRTLETLQTSNASVVRTASGAAQVQPRPARNAVLGLVLGLLLGLALAFLREALDTKVRGAEAITHRLGLPLLGRLAQPPRVLRANDRLVTLDEPNSVHAEAFRMLRTNLEFVNLERGARSLMVTSAVQGEGKSTTAANLAVTLARGGQHVLLVDLDLRRPYLDKFFDLDGRPGLTDVVLGHVPLERAIAPVPLVAPAKRNLRQNGAAQAGGLLEVLGSGPIPPNPGEYVSSSALGDVFSTLVSRASVIVIDAPPLLSVGDAMALSARVDAMLIVTRLNIIRRPMLNELKRALDASLAPALGFILAGAELDEAYGYGYGYEYGYTHKSHDDGNVFDLDDAVPPSASAGGGRSSGRAGGE
jgi:polysaccharide biosynthesis transport protein